MTPGKHEAPAQGTQEPAESEGVEGGTPTSDGGESAPDARTTWRRVYLMARPRATRANLFALALAALLGFAIATQVRQTQAQDLESLRQDELVRILDDVTQNGNRLEGEARELERTRDELRSGAGTSEQAKRTAQERLDTLGILAGTQAATGPGIRLTIEDPEGRVSAATLLDTLQELRDAGGEAMQVGDVRVVASTYFTDEGSDVLADGEKLERPYVFVVIGDPHTMSSAMGIPGGVTQTVRGLGGTVSIEEFESVNVTALHTISPPQYAQPVPEPSTDDS